MTANRYGRRNIELMSRLEFALLGMNFNARSRFCDIEHGLHVAAFVNNMRRHAICEDRAGGAKGLSLKGYDTRYAMANHAMR